MSEIESLKNILNQQGAIIKILDNEKTLADDLKTADSFIIIAPASAYTQDENQTVTDFVKRGGRLLVITDPTRNFSMVNDPSTSMSSLDIANTLLEDYGIAYANDYVYNLQNNEGNFRNVIFSSFSPDPLTRGLSTVVFYSAHSLVTHQTALIKGDQQIFSSITDRGSGLVVAAVDANNQVLVLGDLTFFSPPFSQTADNNRLIQNIASFLMESKRAHDLADFPFLFKQKVFVQTAKDIEKGAAFTGALGEIQNALVSQHLNLELADQSTPAGNDRLVLSLFPPDEKTTAELLTFGISFASQSGTNLEPTADPLQSATPFSSATKEPETIQTGIPAINGDLINLPGFGEMAISNLGLLAYHHDAKSSTLLMLSDTNEHLFDLMKLYSSGDLTGCVTQKEIAVCQVGTGN
jgi:hypothetical protein